MKRSTRAAPKPRVGVVLGSDSDLPVMEETLSVLEEAGVRFEVRILSAHRAPEVAARYAKGAARRGLKVLIAAASGAAHLAGALAANSVLPVIGVPLEGTRFKGTDAFLSTLQMPPGVPVATVSVGRWGARNAGLLAISILALERPGLARYIKRLKRELLTTTLKKDRKLKRNR